MTDTSVMVMDLQERQLHGSDDEGEKIRTASRRPGSRSSTEGGIQTKSTSTAKLKARRELPAGAVSTLKAWLLSPEHFTHPYPTPQEQYMLMQKTGIDKKQLKTWFTNARRRIWKPLLKKQLELGKVTQTGSGSGSGSRNVVIMPATAHINTSPGLMSADPINSQTEQQNYQHTLHHQQQSNDQYGNPTYECIPHQQNPFHTTSTNTNSPSYYQQGQSTTASTPQPHVHVPPVPTIPQVITTSSSSSSSATSMNKIDSRALLNELFERELMNNQNQHPMNSKMEGGTSTVDKHGPGPGPGMVPSMDSWPHFSSVSSLNNLGTMTGVKSITKLCSGSASSGADLVGQGGSLNKEGNMVRINYKFASMMCVIHHTIFFFVCCL